MQNLQTMVDEKQDQLIKKGEALVECQTSNVKNLCGFAQAVKERMSEETEIETLKKLMETSRKLYEEKENQILKERLQQQESDRLTLQTCQEELKQVQKENHRLQEKLQLQEMEFEPQREFWFGPGRRKCTFLKLKFFLICNFQPVCRVHSQVLGLGV